MAVKQHSQQQLGEGGAALRGEIYIVVKEGTTLINGLHREMNLCIIRKAASFVGYLWAFMHAATCVPFPHTHTGHRCVLPSAINLPDSHPVLSATPELNPEPNPARCLLNLNQTLLGVC